MEVKKLPTLQNIYAAGAECIHGCSDQIPVHTYMWVNIGREKQAYCGDDVKKMNTEDFKEMHKKKKRADRAINDKEAAEEDEDKKEAGEDNK